MSQMMQILEKQGKVTADITRQVKDFIAANNTLTAANSSETGKRKAESADDTNATSPENGMPEKRLKEVFPDSMSIHLC